MATIKRPLDCTLNVANKRPRTDVTIYDNKKDVVAANNINSIPRTSNLLAPNMQLSGHQGEVFCGKFSPDGTVLTTAGHDNKILFWSVFKACKNIGTLTGHNAAILDIEFSNDGEWLYSASVDKTIAIWDTQNGERLRRLRGHTSFINSVSPMPNNKHLFCSGSDDNKIRLWDKRSKNTVHMLDARYPVLSTCYSSDGNSLFSAGIENVINQWDTRENKIINSYRGHNDTVTGISASHDGNFLLSNSMDNTMRVWDVRPFVKGDRCYRIMLGHKHSFERNLLRASWSPDDRRVSCGSSERHVHVWDVHTSQLIYKLPGHTGAVNETCFHPNEPIIASVGTDSRVFVGEVDHY